MIKISVTCVYCRHEVLLYDSLIYSCDCGKAESEFEDESSLNDILGKLVSDGLVKISISSD